MKILVEVNCEPGEEYLRVSEIDKETLDVIIPIIDYIFNELDGFYPTGDYSEYITDSRIETLQQSTYIERFEKFLPLPTHGFDKILNIEVL